MPALLCNTLRRPEWMSLCMFVPLLMCATGCSSLSALGIPVGSKHKMLKSTEEISRSVTFAPPLNRELNKTVLAEYIVEPSDVLYVEPARFDSPVRLPGDQPVQPDGTIEIGQYGRLFVVGKSIAQIQQEAQRVIEKAEPKSGPIVVRLIAWDSKEFYVLGEVSSPGAYHFDGNETVLDAIIAAGGLNNSASKKRIVLTRPSQPENCRMVLPICYDQIVQLGDTSTNYQLMPGDRVFVGTKTLMDSIKETFSCCHDEEPCPRCTGMQYGCDPGCLTTHTTYTPPIIMLPPVPVEIGDQFLQDQPPAPPVLESPILPAPQG